MNRKIKNSGPTVVAACVAAAGAVAAIAFIVLKRSGRRSAMVLKRCGKAAEELERIAYA